MNTEIITIFDRSGSMATTIRSAREGYNTFLAEQRKAPGAARATLVQFDHQTETLYSGLAVSLTKKLTDDDCQPRGSTALLDAIGTTLEEQGKRIAEEGWASKVIVCIITDGAENSSKEFTAERIKEMVAHAESHGWSFVYLAANVDAFITGASMGISPAHTMAYAATNIGTTTAYRSMSVSVTSLRAETTPAVVS